MPELTQFDSEKSMMRYLPANGIAGFARLRVRCASRSPRPPAMTTAMVLFVSWLTKRPDFLGFTTSDLVRGGRCPGPLRPHSAMTFIEIQYNPRFIKALLPPIPSRA